MGLLSRSTFKSTLDKTIKEEILFEKGAQTRKVLIEKYTAEQRRKDFEDKVFNAMLEIYNDYLIRNITL